MTLVPKFEGAKEMKDYRPISMVSYVYRVIAKILERRTRKVMGEMVGEPQSAFIQDRKILDDALIAYKSVHWLKNAKKGG